MQSVPCPADRQPPGSVFLYNSGATYMLSAIVQKVTGQKVIDYLRPRLFEPLQIAGMTWETCPRGINTGGWGLSRLTPKPGQIRPVLSAKRRLERPPGSPRGLDAGSNLFQDSTAAAPERTWRTLKVTSDWHQGYCYQFWRCRHNAFRGDGASGQFAIVMPDQDAVVSITCETANMQRR